MSQSKLISAIKIEDQSQEELEVKDMGEELKGHFSTLK